MNISNDFFSDQESAVVASTVRKLLLNFITRPRFPFDGSTYPFSPEGNQSGVLQRVGSVAGNIVLSISLHHSKGLL